MSKGFMDMIEDAIGSSTTENGAKGYRSSGHALLDLNFAVSSLRNADPDEIADKFRLAYGEDRESALVWLFFARDVRGGMGERRLFRVCMNWLASQHAEDAKKLLLLIPEYGRWDDLIDLMGTSLHHDVLPIIGDQLRRDMRTPLDGHVSLLAKWLPSECSGNPLQRKRARQIMKFLSYTPRLYRRLCSSLRKQLDVVERKMSANEWGAVNYPGVPSRANLVYNSAFLRHDEQRRREFLESVKKGEAKINASVLFPHDIVAKYTYHLMKRDYWGFAENIEPDEGLEALWNALPKAIPDGGSTIVVADGSGSMESRIGSTEVTALDVANALAIYFAERLPEGPYRNKYITFSMTPQLVDLTGRTTLISKLYEALEHDECSNTNVEDVFSLLLSVAVDNRLRQDEIPQNILILSDMEFDRCARRSDKKWGWKQLDAPLFREIANDWAQHGYKLPRLIFWNIRSRTLTVPVRENEMGVALVSGFSPNVAKMVMSAKLDPMDALMETLNGRRYDAVREALKEGK